LRPTLETSRTLVLTLTSAFEVGAVSGDEFSLRMLHIARRWIALLDGRVPAREEALGLVEQIRAWHDDESTPGYELMHDIERWLSLWS
jgi:hypothetical protein